MPIWRDPTPVRWGPLQDLLSTAPRWGEPLELCAGEGKLRSVPAAEAARSPDLGG
ncbi:hypothetical protein RIMD111065_12220 [Aeromonas hydrophila]|nr:hypothetical protein RIMD111065_12220 [Aeromonas hydrophila]